MSSEPMIAICSKEWKRRILLIALFIFAGSSWFLYDGAVGYPKANERAVVYFALKEEITDPDALKAAWETTAAEQGWNPDKVPKKIYSQQDLWTQFAFAILGYLGVAATLGYFFWSLPRRLEYRDERLTLPDGRVIDITTIKSIDKRAWKSKGIARVRHELAPGRLAKFQLDDYKFIGTAEILEVIQTVLKEKKAS